MKDYYVMKIVNYSDRTEVYHDYPGEIEYAIYDYSYSTCAGDEYYDIESAVAVRNYFELRDHNDYEYDERFLDMSIRDNESILNISIVRKKYRKISKDEEGETLTIYFRNKDGKWNVIVEERIMCETCEYGLYNVDIRMQGGDISPEKCCEEPEDAKEFLEMIKKIKNNKLP
jgi:hypothetical protein